jgi:hypothetical protein
MEPAEPCSTNSKDGNDSFTKAGEVAKNDDVDLNSSS